MMLSTHRNTLGGTMGRTVWIILSAAIATIVVAGAVIWFNTESYEDTVANCQKALAAQSKAGGEGKPDACEGVKEDDYAAIVLSNAIDRMPKKDRDTLDYFDDGTINGSLD